MRSIIYTILILGFLSFLHTQCESEEFTTGVDKTHYVSNLGVSILMSLNLQNFIADNASPGGCFVVGEVPTGSILEPIIGDTILWDDAISLTIDDPCIVGEYPFTYVVPCDCPECAKDDGRASIVICCVDEQDPCEANQIEITCI